MKFTTRPLKSWPRPLTEKRTSGGYSTDYNRTLSQLAKELKHLDVIDEAVIQLDLQEDKIRVDGSPYADARPKTPCVAISFTSRKHGHMTYYCDAHHYWTSNVRAIALGLERLRLLEKTGITSRGEQYTGFKQLPGEVGPPPKMNVNDAALAIARAAADFSFIKDEELEKQTAQAGADQVKRDADTYRTIYRLAVKRVHPDAGGDPAAWQRVQEAAGVLENHFGLS